MKANFKASCAIVALISGYAGVVHAQAQDAAGQPNGIEELVVTATRRSESIQKVPTTIQAFSGKALSELDVTSFNDLLKLVPNVSFGSNGPGSGNIFIRGLSSGFAGNQSSATIGSFPNVALYLDDQSLTFPFRNVDVYVVDMERVEVLEGPQGTLFGGGAEAGAVRYITNKPKLDEFSGYAEISGGGTAHGDGNYAGNLTLNLPIVKDVAALRVVVYDDHRGGYIDNVPSTFTRKPTDNGPASYGLTYPANAPGTNNFNLASKAQNPTNYAGARVSGLVNFNDDWNVLIQQSFQALDAEGMNAQYPIGSDGQTLGPLQETSFSSVGDHDHFYNTAWTVNGQIGDIKLIYNGSYLTRHIDQTMDYTNYARTAGGFYYQCTGGAAGSGDIGAGTPEVCYSPLGSWHDIVASSHHTEELRAQTPNDWRLRGLVGFFYENLDIKDNMNFLYKSIPSCTASALAAFNAGGPVCVGNVAPAPGSFANDPSARGDTDAFGEDIDRGYNQYALYGSIDFDIIPQVLTVTAGTRFYHYDEYEFGSQYATTTDCAGIPNGTCFGTPLTAATHAASYTGAKSRANITYHIDDTTMTYFTFSQGFRPGAGNRLNSAEVKISVDPATGLPTTGVVTGSPKLVKQFNKPFTYAPDVLYNYEIGLKSEFFQRRLLVNASAYIMDWNNVQTLIYNPPVFGNTTFGTNGPDYNIKGAELQLKAQATEQLSFDGSASYNYSRESNSPCIKSTNPGNPTPIGQCITQVYSSLLHQNVPLVNPLGSVGATPAFSPPWQLSFRTRYDWDMDDYHAYVTVGVNYTGKQFSEPSSFPAGQLGVLPTTTFLRFTMPSYETVDASIGLSKDNWSAQIYGTNLNNSNASTYTSSAQFIVSQVPLRPRVIGAKIGVKFGGPSEPEAAPAAYVPPPVQAPMQAPKSYMVFFDFNKSDLTPQAAQIVDTVAKNAGPAKVTQLTVTGHTDTVGSDAYNMRLSKRRAESVAAELEKDGIPSSEIEIVAKGKRDLLVPTADGVKEPQNRRVQIVYDNGMTS